MELFYLTCLLLLGGSLAEPRVDLMLSKTRAEVGDEVLITCKVRGVNEPDNTDVTFKKIVDIASGEEAGRYEQDITSGRSLTLAYKDEGRFELNREISGTSAVDVKVTIRNVNAEDSAIYACSLVGTESYAAHDFEVYRNPSNVHFTNYSNNDIVNFEEGDAMDNFECMAMEAAPVPRFEVFVTDGINYTSVFKYKESSVHIPECYVQNKPEETSCLLHFFTESSVLARNFRPDYSSNGQDLVCRATLDESDLAATPKEGRIRINMEFAPKFRCFPKQKVELYTEDYEMKCTILSNPKLDTVSFELQVDGEKETLNPGQKSSDGQIQFLQVTKTKETEVVLKFEKVLEQHFDMKFKLMAENSINSNSTTIEFVEKDYERWSSASFVTSSFLTIVSVMMSFVLYHH